MRALPGSEGDVRALILIGCIAFQVFTIAMMVWTQSWWMVSTVALNCHTIYTAYNLRTYHE